MSSSDRQSTMSRDDSTPPAGEEREPGPSSNTNQSSSSAFIQAETQLAPAQDTSSVLDFDYYESLLRPHSILTTPPEEALHQWLQVQQSNSFRDHNSGSSGIVAGQGGNSRFFSEPLNATEPFISAGVPYAPYSQLPYFSENGHAFSGNAFSPTELDPQSFHSTTSSHNNLCRRHTSTTLPLYPTLTLPPFHQICQQDPEPFRFCSMRTELTTT
ncbi:hypothetical protein BDR26DRAFT_997897 [Obelidium mucronatum]|nr:hypothetical protein BDR26DRAFT_997897 [Obelidium mucronatum]